jgi:peptide deformylase
VSAPRRPAVLPITKLGERVLRERGQAIRDWRSPALQELIDRMIATMKVAQGVGIAANQVGVGIRLFIVAPEPNPRYPKSPRWAPLPMINPKLVRHSKETVEGWEGCLSIPGLRGIVPRFRCVEIEYISREGQRERRTLRDFVARIFQHELDHINGKVFVDRVRNTRTFVTDTEYARQQLWKRPSFK